MSSRSYAKPEFMRPKTSRNGKHLDTMMKDFGSLLDNMQNATHRMTIYNSMLKFIKHKSCNKTYISDEQLHAIELCIYHGIKVQHKGLKDARISQIFRCTAIQSWHSGD
jgi:hypothetical protein